eukprot:962415-Pyramimonas_sp.AAC.1
MVSGAGCSAASSRSGAVRVAGSAGLIRRVGTRWAGPSKASRGWAEFTRPPAGALCYARASSDHIPAATTPFLGPQRRPQIG